MFPFTSYDFWAYLASGFLRLGAIDLVLDTQLLLKKDWTWVQIALAVTFSYVLGHLGASMSSMLYERGLLGKVLGYPNRLSTVYDCPHSYCSFQWQSKNPNSILPFGNLVTSFVAAWMPASTKTTFW